MSVQPEPILKVRNLSTQLQIGANICHVIENVNFDLYPGKTLAIVGETGCGKTMTALSIMRILPSPPVVGFTGEVIYKDRNILTISEKEMRKLRGAKLAMIFQDPTSALNPVYNIGYQLNEMVELHLGIYGDEAHWRAIKALKEVGMPSPERILEQYPFQLSGGMRQRVMIAMALICEPDILIADEPTTALDVTIQAQVLELIRDLQKKKGMALLLITHDMGVVAEMAHDVIVMYAAQPVEQGNVFHIFDHMSHPYTIGLFKSRPNFQSSRGKLHVIRGAVPSITNMPIGCRFHPRCPYVMEKCQQGDVPNFDVKGENKQEGHKTRCWLYDGSEESSLRWKHPNAGEET